MYDSTKEHYWELYELFIIGMRMDRVAKKKNVSVKSVDRAIKWCRNQLLQRSRAETLRDEIESLKLHILGMTTVMNDARNAGKSKQYAILNDQLLKYKSRVHELEGVLEVRGDIKEDRGEELQPVVFKISKEDGL